MDLDPVAALLDREVRSGRLPRSHIFYRVVSNALKFANEIGDPTNQFKHDPIVRSFCETLQRSGHWRTFNLLTGKRMLHRGRGSAHDFCWEDNNIPLPLPLSRNGGYVYENGLVRAYVIAFLRMAFSQGSEVVPLISNDALRLIPISFAKDGFTLKPGFQVDQHTMLVVGGIEHYSLADVKEHQDIRHDYFSDKFVKEVEIMGVTSLDNKSALIIGNDFVGAGGDGNSTLQCHMKRLRELQQCLHCLQDSSDLVINEDCLTTECPECVSKKEVCGVCKEKGSVHWYPVLRRCDRCFDKGIQCSRAICLNLTTDCQSMFKAALEILEEKQSDGTADSYSALAAPNPDIVHAGKNVHRSHCNWFMFIEKARFSLVMLRTARLDSSCSKDLKAVLTDVALRGRDRMDTSYVAECNRVNVVEVLQRMGYLVHTLVPEMFWKEYGLNKPGVLVHPISVCCGAFGLLYVVDYTLGSLFKVRLHNPADVELLAKDILHPTCVIYESGVIFVAEEDSLSYLDVGKVVQLNPKALKKPRLQEELCKRGLLGRDDRVSVTEMRSMLSNWIKENPPASQKSNGLISLLEGVSALAFCANEDRSILYVSQRNNPTILKVTVTCTGTVLKADVEPFITISSKACCTGLAFNKETRDILVANSQDDGGIYMIDAASEDRAATCVKMIHNGTDVCSRAYGVAISHSGDTFFTDVDAHKIGKLLKGSTCLAEYTMGSEGEEPHDGCDKTAVFVQPTGLCTEGDSLYLTDTGAGALKLISPTNPIANFLKHVRLLYSSHGIHSPPASLQTATRLLDEATQYFEAAVEEAKVSAGSRKTVEGPHGVPSSKTVASIRMTLEALRGIERELKSVNPAYINHVNPKSLVTLIVEHFNSKMREVYEVPTVLQFSHQFPAAVEETVKRTTNCGFNYFTSRKSYYEVPEDMIAFEELPDIPRPPKKHGTQGELSLMRKWANEYGRSARQLSVRAKSTKDNPGTLPVSAYGRRGLQANPSSSLSEIRDNIDSDSPASDNEDEADYVTVTTDPVPTITFSKGSTLLISHDERVSGPFLFGNLVQDWKPRSLTDTAKVHMYAPDPEDCLLLHYEFTGIVKFDQVVCQLNGDENIAQVDDDYQLEISDHVYHQCVMRLSRLGRAESSPTETVEPASVGHTSRGRSLRLPHRFRK